MTDLRNVRTRTFTGSSLEDVAAEAETWLKAGGEETDQGRLLDWSYDADGGTHHIVILYTE